MSVSLLLISCKPPEEGSTVDLSENLKVPHFGINFDYHAGWTTETYDAGIRIYEKGGDEYHEDYQITLSFLSVEGYQAFFIFEDLILSELHEFNISNQQWKDPIEVIDVELFGVPAKHVRAAGRMGWEVNCSGVRNNETFDLVFTAPNEEALDAFMPTVERIMERIR